MVEWNAENEKKEQTEKIPTKLIILSDQSCFEDLVMTEEGAEQNYDDENYIEGEVKLRE